jgi:hypothetical protein
VSGKTIPSTTAVDFLPYPNDGEAAFKQKYGAMDLDALAGPMLRLRDRLNEEVERLVQERYDKGLFDERVYKTPEAANADSSRPDLPQGMGQVWPCERATSQPDGSLKHWTTVLTEAEYPQLFAHQAEYLWVASTYHYMQKQAGKH